MPHESTALPIFISRPQFHFLFQRAQHCRYFITEYNVLKVINSTQCTLIIRKMVSKKPTAYPLSQHKSQYLPRFPFKSKRNIDSSWFGAKNNLASELSINMTSLRLIHQSFSQKRWSWQNWWPDWAWMKKNRLSLTMKQNWRVSLPWWFWKNPNPLSGPVSSPWFSYFTPKNWSSIPLDWTTLSTTIFLPGETL